jgi:hypothetical protein
MITVGRYQYGTAAEVARALGPDVTPGMVYRWAERDGLERHHDPGVGRGTVRYRLDEAARIEAAKRNSGRGRPRRTQTARG